MYRVSHAKPREAGIRFMASRAAYWKNGLQVSMNDAEAVIETDDKIIIIKDKYPKAKYHFLVLPRQNLASLKDVSRNDLDLLRHMQKKGEEIANKADKELLFFFGYHAIPSMNHLHMHVISQDFNSPCLKTKKHWNSFTTPYFIHSDSLIKKIEQNENWLPNEVDMQQLLKEELRCHVCKKIFQSIPSLKAHIALHNFTKM